MSSSVSKIVAERSHRTLLQLVLKPGNDVCADCKARAPRWASWNLGIFICVSCASIHRKIGTHITKVKSITLDEWSKEQVEVMKERGNIKSNALYNPDETRHPPPTNMIGSERDSELERFIRSKYEFKRFMHRKSDPTSQHLSADSRASTAPRVLSTPLTDSPKAERKPSPGPPLPPKTPENLPSSLRPLASLNQLPPRSFSQPLPPLTSSDKLTAAPPLRQHAATQPFIQKPAGKIWEDLISLQEPSQSSSLPLQYSPVSPIVPFPSQPQTPVQHQAALGNAPNPFLNLPLGPTGAALRVVASPISVSAPSAQYPFAPSAPFASPAHQFGAPNPFNHAPLPTSTTGTTFATRSNPFSSMPHMAMSMASAPVTPTVPTQQAMGLTTGAVLHTPPLPYATSTTAPGLSFPQTTTPFGAGPATPGGLAPNPFAPVGVTGQVPLANPSATANPFSAMHMRHVGYPGSGPGTPQSAFVTTAFLQQQPPQPPLNGFGGWAGQGAHGAF